MKIGNANFIAFCLTRSGLETTIYHNLGQHANYILRTPWMLLIRLVKFALHCDLQLPLPANDVYKQLQPVDYAGSRVCPV